MSYRVKTKRNVPPTSINCYRVRSGFWVAVVTCLESCLYKTKLYRYRRPAYDDALEMRKALEKDVDDSCRVVSEFEEQDNNTWQSHKT